MKTSNKILIAFAGALILIPLLGMIYVSQVQYKTGRHEDMVDVVASSQKHFNTPTENMESKALPNAFSSINIEDAKNLGLYINFVQDENYGVKVPKELKDSVNFNVDATGQLQITLNMRPSKNDRNFTTIIVYGKEIKQVDISNASFLYFDVTSDSVQLNLKKSGSVTLNKDITVNALRITTDEVEELAVNEIKVKSLNVTLNGTNFKSDGSSYDNLSITASGKSEIQINGSDKGNHSIKNLFINTLHEADFKLENIKVEKCSGSFSDQTKVQMPAVNLNQMYKK